MWKQILGKYVQQKHCLQCAKIENQTYGSLNLLQLLASIYNIPGQGFAALLLTT